MKKYTALFFFFNSFSLLVFGQQSQAVDTIKSQGLEEVIIRAYEQNRRPEDVPGAINYVSSQMLNRYNNTSILNGLNATAGVKMEERSPGSYRLSIRGSSLRSPFGVRNVKIYYNNIPFTDPGGNTYLNQLGFYNAGSVEVLKGPGSSLYGAGTGGVMLIESNNASRPRGIGVSYSGGSYGLTNSNIYINTGSDSFRNIINYQHQSSNGYRDWSKLRRDVFSWETSARLSGTERITGTFLYGDLYYQTPGALTLKEYNENATASRPVAGVNVSARQAAAAIYQKMFLSGITYQKNISNNWQNTSSVYGAFTKLDNPAIRNYARNNQPHFGGRTIFQYKKVMTNAELMWHTGAELQQSFNTAKVYKNNKGNTDSLQADDEININSYFVFTQLTYAVKTWIFTAGASLNRSKLNFTRFSTVPSKGYNIGFNNQLTPRLAILKKIQPHISAYASWSKGFSPPTSDELFPTGSLSNPNLSAEQGDNYELGLKGYTLQNRLSFDVSAFFFRLKNAIVQRRDAAGGDYYINAGNTRQKGIETQLSYHIIRADAVSRAANIWLSHTLYRFNYGDFKQLENDFSGKRLPGVAKQTLTAGFDYQISAGLYANITYQYSDPVPLDDANGSYAASYNLLSCRLGYKKSLKKINVDLFAGADNLTDVKYSLGNDLNAFGGRYYNAAAGRNFYGGVNINFNY